MQWLNNVMSNIFFTADTHFFHTNIIKYCNRPFKDSIEMNETIIRRWNDKVGRDDLIFHLGDFAFVKNRRLLHLLLERLNGKIVLIKGNHDKFVWENRDLFYAHHDSYHEICLGGQDITLCHYKMAIWNKSHRGAWHLYGHSHGTAPNHTSELSFDVGVDCHHFTPLSLDDVARIMTTEKNFKPIDHHGRDDKPFNYYTFKH